jgi:hypothetical protein
MRRTSITISGYACNVDVATPGWFGTETIVIVFAAMHSDSVDFKRQGSSLMCTTVHSRESERR